MASKVRLFINNNKFLIDRILIFLCVFSVFPAMKLSIIKFSIIAICTLYILIFKKLIIPKSIIFLLSFLALTLIMNINSINIDTMIYDGINMFLFGVVIYFLLYNLVYESTSKHTNEKAIFLVLAYLFDVFFVILFFTPTLMGNISFSEIRLDGSGFLDMFSFSSNLIAYIIFTANILSIYAYQQIKIDLPDRLKFIDKRHKFAIFVYLQFVLFIFGVLTRSRGYYLLMAIFLAVYFYIKFFYSKISVKTKRNIVIAVFSVTILSFYLILFTDLAYQASKMIEFSNRNVFFKFLSLLQLGSLKNQNMVIDASTIERLSLIKYSWIKFLENPMFGQGIGVFIDSVTLAPYYGVVAIFNNTYSHVEIFELLVGTGITGTFLYYTGIKNSISFKRDHLLIFSMIIASIIAGFFFRIYYNKTVWWIMIAINHLNKVNGGDQNENEK